MICETCEFLQRIDDEWGICLKSPPSKNNIALFLPELKDCPIGQGQSATTGKIEQQIEELVQAGIFRDLRCPKCNSCWVDTITVSEVPARHRCFSCENEFTDEDLEENENDRRNI